MSTASEISEGLGPIRDRFLVLLHKQQMEILDELDVVLNTPDHSLDAFGRIESKLHKTAGTAGTLGLVDLGNTARHAEEQIMAYRAGDPTRNADEACDAVIRFLGLSIEVSTQAA